MNIYLIGVLTALFVFFIVGMLAGRKVKDTNDYYVAGRNAPVPLIVGSLVASFLSTGAFLGDTGEVYSGFFMGIVIVGVLQASGYIYGAGLFGKYIRRSQVNTVPEYFGVRFHSEPLRKLSALVMMCAVCAYMLSAMQGVATIMSSITGLSYGLSVVIAWFAFTAFTIYAGSPGVLLTDTIMFLVFLVAALIAVPFVIHSAGGWFPTIAKMAVNTEIPGIIAWTNNLDYLYPTGAQNLVWAVTYGIVWALVVSISPWQTSRYLMARNEHTVMRSSIWASIGVMVVTVSLYFTAVFIRSINGELQGSGAVIWAAMNVMPTFVGIVMLTGITAAGISSASTFLSLIGFSLVNDIFRVKDEDEKKRLRVSRLAMLISSLVVLALAYFNPPQIFWIMYFGGTVIASSWSVVALGSVWSKSLNKRGAFAGMLCGFLGCVAMKALSALLKLTLPIYLDPFFVGIALSAVGAAVGSALGKTTPEERAEREKLFEEPECERDEAEVRRTNRLWIVYAVFGVLVGAFFLFMYAIPYLRAVG